MKTKLIVGHYGSGNYGDDIMLDELLHEYKDEKSKTHVRVIFFQENSLDFDVEKIFINRYNRFEYISKIFTSVFFSSEIIWGGGTCITDEEGDGFFWGMLLSFLLGKKIHYRSIGIGKLQRRSRILKFHILMKISKSVGFREKNSYQFAVDSVNDCAEKFYSETDLGYKYLKRFSTASASFEKSLVISWRDLSDYGIKLTEFDNLIPFIFSLMSEYHLNKIYILDADNLVDIKTHDYIEEKIRACTDKKLQRFKNLNHFDKTMIIQKSSIVFTSRLHIMMAAAIFNKIVYIYDYSPKIKNCACDLNLSVKFVELK